MLHPDSDRRKAKFRLTLELLGSAFCIMDDTMVLWLATGLATTLIAVRVYRTQEKSALVSLIRELDGKLIES